MVAVLPLIWTAPCSIAPFYNAQSVLVRLLRALSFPTHIVFRRSIPEFAGENVEQTASSPSFLAVGVVGEVVGCDSSKSVLEIVWSRPRICGSNGDFGRRFEDFGLFLDLFCGHDGHAGCRYPTFTDEVFEDLRGWAVQSRRRSHRLLA